MHPEKRQKKGRAGTGALKWVLRERLVTDYSAAVDGGSNVGEWTRRLALVFGFVHCFEPVPESINKWHARVGHLKNVALFPWALMDREGPVHLITPNKRTTLTARQVAPAKPGEGTASGIPLDYMALRNIGLIKLDLEGAEPLALQGAKQTIARCRPVLIIEFNRQTGKRFTSLDAMHKQILDMGYKHIHDAHVDRIFIPVR